MRYLLKKSSSDPDVLAIHFRKRFSPPCQRFETPDDKVDIWLHNEVIGHEDPPVYIKRIWEVDGVVLIRVNHYSLQIEKGTAFRWKEIIGQILAILNVELFPESEPEPITKRTRRRNASEKGILIRASSKKRF
jgi:hypothetical protein